MLCAGLPTPSMLCAGLPTPHQSRPQVSRHMPRVGIVGDLAVQRRRGQETCAERMRGSPDPTLCAGLPTPTAVRGSPDPAPIATAGLPAHAPSWNRWRPGASSGGEVRRPAPSALAFPTRERTFRLDQTRAWLCSGVKRHVEKLINRR